MDRPKTEAEFVERVIADWSASEPPADFTDKVLAATRRGSKSRPGWKPFAVAGILAAAAGIALYVQSRREPPGVVTFVDGAVEVESRGGRSPLSDGSVLEATQRVLTTTGRVEMSLLKRARVSVGPGSVFAVGPGLPAARLERGRASFDVLPGKEQFRVDTPVGSIVVTGTAFEIEVLDIRPEDEDMQRKALGLGIAASAVIGIAAVVHVSRGAVRVETNDGNAPVRAGQQVTLIPGESPRPGDGGQSSLSPDPVKRAQLAAVGLALENARLKSEVSALKARAGESPAASPKTDVATPPGKASGERERIRKNMTREEREFVKDAQNAVLTAQAQELRKFCPELVGDNANIGDNELVAKAATTAISGLLKAKATEDKEAMERFTKLLAGANRPSAAAPLEERTLWQLTQEEAKLRAELEKHVSRERAAEVAEANRQFNLSLGNTRDE